ncbi:MAG TPA: hypothetical protein PLE61_03535 [Vicinamibacterales bacterium]|nr:hypothetical protein [Vicinamibacterales bacterium]HPW19864.1 hypothetical protein [Vicinamibacterales bacterium]
MRAARILSSVAAAFLAGACAAASVVEVPVETPIKPKLDASAFDRVYVAGFLAGGEEDVDANIETVRLLRSQLRNKASLRVIEADVLPLMDAAAGAQEGGAATAQTPLAAIREEKDLEPYEKVFERKDYWKKIGDEYQGPLIVTGSVIFVPHQRSGYVQREQETYDAFGRRSVVPTRTYMDRKGYILKPKFIFIDGRTGETLHTETFREEVLYNAEQSTPALSAYFELMDRLLPSFLATLSSQSIKGTRMLIR